MSERLRIVIGEENPDVLKTAMHMLQNDFRVVAASEQSPSFIDDVARLDPDVVVLDISMGERNGFDIARQLKLNLCRSKIVFLTVHEELVFIRAAFDAGASGYVFKSRMCTDLKAAITTVLSDKVFIPEGPIPQSCSANSPL